MRAPTPKLTWMMKMYKTSFFETSENQQEVYRYTLVDCTPTHRIWQWGMPQHSLYIRGAGRTVCHYNPRYQPSYFYEVIFLLTKSQSLLQGVTWSVPRDLHHSTKYWFFVLFSHYNLKRSKSIEYWNTYWSTDTYHMWVLWKGFKYWSKGAVLSHRIYTTTHSASSQTHLHGNFQGGLFPRLGRF